MAIIRRLDSKGIYVSHMELQVLMADLFEVAESKEEVDYILDMIKGTAELIAEERSHDLEEE